MPLHLEHITPGREVSPGETPPAEASATSAISYPEPELRVGWGPIPLVMIMLVVALTGPFIGGQISAFTNVIFQRIQNGF